MYSTNNCLLSTDLKKGHIFSSYVQFRGDITPYEATEAINSVRNNDSYSHRMPNSHRFGIT